MNKKLYRAKHDKKLAGVCGGIAKYFGIDSSLVRVAWVILSLFAAGVLAYIICALIIPEEPDYIEAE